MRTARSMPRRGVVYPHLAYAASLKQSRMRLGLESVARALGRLGDPQRGFPSILVAGTNGKGSTATYISSILNAAGLRVGTYYSPHLFRLHERIRVDGAEISSRDLDRLLGRARAASREDPLTYFELLTASAALHFLERRVDVAVVEVGLGGRLDATNLVDPAATVITGISLDHREHLGATRRRILAEKLGIVRAGVPLVAHLGERALREQARLACERSGAPFHSVSDETRCEAVFMSPGEMILGLSTARRDYGALSSRMIGSPQVANVATAVRTIEIVSARPPRVARRSGGAAARLAARLGGAATVSAVRRGVGAAFLAGRFQAVSLEPLVILDVSHNEESFGAAVDTLRRISDPARTSIVFGMLAHKELGGFPARAAGAARTIVLPRLSDPRAAAPERLAGIFRRAASARGGVAAAVRTASCVAEAVEAARASAGPAGSVLVMGSHVTVEEASRYI